MALEFDKDKFNKNAITETITTASVTAPVKEEKKSAAPIPIVEEPKTNNTIGIQVQQSNEPPKEPIQTVEDRFYELAQKYKSGELKEGTPEYEEFMSIKEGMEYSNQKMESQVNGNSELSAQEKAQRKAKVQDYINVMSNGTTEYQKASLVIDKYLTENDTKYSALSEKEKKDKRDKIIHDLQEEIHNKPSKSLSFKERTEGFTNIAKIIISAGATDRNIEDINVKEELKKIKNFQIHKLADIINNIDFTADTDVDTKLHQFGEALLAKDPKYNQLNGKAKEEYLENKLASLLSKAFFGIEIPKETLQNNKRTEILKKTFVHMLANAQKSNIPIDEVLSNPDIFNKAVITNIENNMDQINKMPESDRNDILRLKTRLELMRSMPDATEKDLFENLDKKAKNGKITKEEENLYNFYKEIMETNPKCMEEKANTRNIITASILLGDSVDNIALEDFSNLISKAKTAKEAELILNDVAKSVIGSHKAATFINEYQKIIADKFYNGDIEKVKINTELRHKEHAYTMANIKLDKTNDPDLLKAGGLSVAAMMQPNNQTPEGKALLKKTISRIDKDGGKYGLLMAQKSVQDAGLKHKESLDTITEAYGNTHSTDAITNATKIISNCGNDAYTSLFTASSIKTAGGKQLELGKKLLELHNSAVTEGVAAAEKFVDASVREEYSRNLTNEINSGHYTDAEKQNFQKARETGQTSYEREQAVNSSNGETKSSESNSTSTSSGSQSSTAKQSSSSSSTYPKGTKVTTGTIYISQEAKTYARDIKATLAMIDSENKKAEAMKKVAENIAKIQKEAIKYEQKAEQKKIEEQIQKAQIVKEENEKKTEEQMKAELSSALDSEIEIISQELPNTQEAQEVQKLFSDQEWFNKLKSCAQAGQLNEVYAMLGKLPNSSIQEKFLEKLATKHISTISRFIQGADKSILKFMCEKNPGIISTLDTNTLMTLCDSGFPKTTIIKFGDKNQVAAMFKDLQSTEGGRRTLGEFYEVMGIADSKDNSDAAENLKKNDEDIPGTDAWARKYSGQSNKVEIANIINPETEMNSGINPPVVRMGIKVNKNVHYLG